MRPGGDRFRCSWQSDLVHFDEARPGGRPAGRNVKSPWSSVGRGTTAAARPVDKLFLPNSRHPVRKFVLTQPANWVCSLSTLIALRAAFTAARLSAVAVSRQLAKIVKRSMARQPSRATRNRFTRLRRAEVPRPRESGAPSRPACFDSRPKTLWHSLAPGPGACHRSECRPRACLPDCAR